MANTDSAALADITKMAYDRAVALKLRAEPQFRASADKMPDQLTNAGSTIRFTFWDELPLATTPLNENVDVDSVALTATEHVDLTLNEYGQASTITRRAQETNFASISIDQAVVNTLAYAMLNSMEYLAEAELARSQQVLFEAAGAVVEVRDGTDHSDDVTATDVLKSRDVRRIVANLQADNVLPREGGLFTAYIHPYVAAGLRAETGDTAWRTAANYQDLASIQAGSLGVFEGVHFIQTSRAGNSANAAGVKVYRTIFLGHEALAEAKTPTGEPQTVVSPVTDKLQRLHSFGWKAFIGWKIYRQKALWVAKTAAPAL